MWNQSATTNLGRIARVCVASFSFLLLFLLRLQGLDCVAQTGDTAPTVTFCDPATPRLMSKVPTQRGTGDSDATRAELLIAGGGSEVFCSLVRTRALHTNLCLNPRHGAPLARVADLWADTTGLEAHFKLVDEGQSALWVHDLLSCLAFPDKAGRIREIEATVPPSRTAPFSHSSLIH